MILEALDILAAASPVDHVTDKAIWANHDGSLWYISNATVMLVLSGILTLLLIIPAAGRIKTGETQTLDDLRSQGILANMIEAICLYLLEKSYRPILGDQADKYAPMLWTLFYFILIANLLGLVPLIDLTGGLLGLNEHNGVAHGVGGTATQSIWVTGALALVAFVWWNAIAIKKDIVGFFAHLTAGTPWFLWPLMIPIEIVGSFIVKPAALALRLFANMTGGHIVVATFLMFIGDLAIRAELGVLGWVGAIAPFLATIAIYFLEVFVAVLQAYIFMFLTCLFLGQLIVHHDHHDDEHGHGHHPHDNTDRVHDVLDASQRAVLGPESAHPGH